MDKVKDILMAARKPILIGLIAFMAGFFSSALDVTTKTDDSICIQVKATLDEFCMNFSSE